jgi:HSP20 family protein
MSNLSRWSPFEETLSLRDAMSKLFEESVVRPFEQMGIAPALDVYETNDAFTVDMVVPGIKPEELDLSLQEQVLTVSGEYKDDRQEQQDRNYHRNERRYGRFSRSVSFPTNIKADEVNANYEHGVLHITVPKAEEVKPRTIKITATEAKNDEN